jgi:glycosyltransferase involved in cell wall biosynthesis
VTQVKAGSRPVRVLHLRDSPWVDGPGRTILETAKRIDRSRVDYHVGAFVTNPDEPHALVDALKADSLPVHAIPDRGGVGQETVDWIVGLIDRLQIDVLHTSEFRSNALALLCRRKRPLKLVSTAHGWIANDLRGHVYIWADRILLRRFDRVILVSHAMRQRLPAWWIPDSRVRVIHNALMTESYGRDVLDRARLPPDTTRSVRLLNVGRLSVEKGQDLLLRAVAALVPEYPGLRLDFAGIGPLEPALRRLADELGIADRVGFLGFVRDMPVLYANTDLVVQSSLTEGLPNVILEAAYLGVPVVATDVGGTREVIEHGVSGWLLPTADVASLVAGLRHYLSRPADFVEMASLGRDRVEQKFAFDARTENQTRIYQELACGAA